MSVSDPSKKKRVFLMVDGVDADVKNQLSLIAQQELGKSNASLLVRQLIAEKLAQYQTGESIGTVNVTDDVERVEVRLPKSGYDALALIAEQKLSTVNAYLVALAFKELGMPQLFTDEIEVLRKSNYELARLSSQIRNLKEVEAIPDSDKVLDDLVVSLRDHIRLVIDFMGNKTVVLDNAKRSG